MKSTLHIKYLLAAALISGCAVAQAPPSPSSPAAPVAPPAAVTPPSPGSPEAPVAPGTLPEQAAPAPTAPSPTHATPTGSAAAQTSVPSGEVAKALQTGQSAHGGKTTEDAPTPSTTGTTSRKSAKKHQPKTTATQQ